jgi:formylglycine-generating enzyme
MFRLAYVPMLLTFLAANSGCADAVKENNETSAGLPIQDAKTYTSKSSGMKFVLLKAGKFTMGSPANEKGHQENETAHEVTLTKDYLLGIHDVTRGQFRKFIEATNYKIQPAIVALPPGKFTWLNCGFTQEDTHPVVIVSWNDAVAYAKWLSKQDGQKYRLPTEAEWEYACRAGSKTRYNFGDAEEDFAKHGNVRDASFRKEMGLRYGIAASDGYAYTSPVGSFKPNSWGLYDMHGNVWQWCSDGDRKYGNEAVTDPIGPGKGERMLRGGSWGERYIDFNRSAFRNSGLPESRSSDIGFRLALDPPPDL